MLKIISIIRKQNRIRWHITKCYVAQEKVSENTFQNCFHGAGFNNADEEQEGEISLSNIDDYVKFENDALKK